MEADSKASSASRHRTETEPAAELVVVQAEALDYLRRTQGGAFQLVYVDPPFNTGKRQSLARTRTSRDPDGDRTGFGGHRYRSERGSELGYVDRHEDYLGFLGPHLEEAARVLDGTGSLFVHLDARELHYAKVFLDGLLGRRCFMNEIVWAYDFGGRSRSRWSAKHDTILWYALDPKHYTFRYEDIDRIPYMAPGLAGPEKAARGKTPTDVWWNTIVSPTGKERTGYPNQKPLAILDRIVRVHSNPGDRVLDFFAGSGTTGAAASAHGRSCVLVDRNPEAIDVMCRRLAAARPVVVRSAGLAPGQAEAPLFEQREPRKPRKPAS
jgi:site-specific DNA-methyltransferase (adenine-specific)